MNVAALWVSVFLFAVGVLSRLAPLADAGGRLFRQFPSEDGYLMLTIARNVALGNGMSVSGGEIPTNGTQPLATLLWAAVFWLAGGEREAGVRGILLVQAGLAVGCACLLWRLGRELLGERPGAAAASLLVSAVWFASPRVVTHSMNCLESGLYALVVIAVALVFARSPGSGRWSAGRCVAAGVLLGLAFWTRNDAVFLVLAACLVHVGWGLWDAAKPVTRRLGETLVFGATSVAVATPWLVFNQLRFGAIVPVSGQSEALDAKFAENVWKIPAAVFEYATVVLPVPNALEESAWVIAAGCAALLVVAALVSRVIRDGAPNARAVACLGSIFAVCLLLFYGLWFGAGYFFSRYLFPVSPLFALLTGAAALRAWEGSDSSARRLWPAAAVALCALLLALDLRLYRNGASHMHFQVIDWVRANVPEDAWVAAPQTGTLGFFHDRTINLDGKVNPAALAARKSDGETTRYYLEQRRIAYLADWHGIAAWAKDPRVAREFELIVDDPAQDLAVLRRRASHP